MQNIDFYLKYDNIILIYYILFLNIFANNVRLLKHFLTTLSVFVLLSCKTQSPHFNIYVYIYIHFHMK